MKVLITGAFGFVGNNLSAYLAQKGHDLWALDVRAAVGRSEGELAASGANGAGRGAYARCFDWGQLEEIPWGEVDAVVHLAGKAHDLRNASDPQSYFDINVGLTKKVIEKFARQDAKTQKKFILFSSVKAVADRVSGVLAEDAVPDPKTPYGQSKLEAERYVQSAVCSGQPAIQSFILRPCMIHGPGNKGNLNLLYGVVRKGLPWPLGAFDNRRSFASIGNVCAVVEGLVMGNAPSGAYQVADDESLSTNELIEVMAGSLGRRPRVWCFPKAWVRGVASVGDALHLPLNSERLKKLTESYIVSNAKIKRVLGWKQMPVSAREGMRKTLESFGHG